MESVGADSDTGYGAWREKGRRIGRQLLEELDVIALEDAIRASNGSLFDPNIPAHPEQGHAYRVGLRDALKEYRRSAGSA